MSDERLEVLVNEEEGVLRWFFGGTPPPGEDDPVSGEGPRPEADKGPRPHTA